MSRDVVVVLVDEHDVKNNALRHAIKNVIFLINVNSTSRATVSKNVFDSAPIKNRRRDQSHKREDKTSPWY